MGIIFYEASRGIDDSPLITHWETKSISRETTFQVDVKDWQVIAKNLAELTREVVADMRQQGHKAKTVTIKIRFSDFQTYNQGEDNPGAYRLRRRNSKGRLCLPEAD